MVHLLLAMTVKELIIRRIEYGKVKLSLESNGVFNCDLMRSRVACLLT